MATSSVRKSLPFLIFATGLLEFPWKIAAVQTDQTISRHRSLKDAVLKAQLLNLERMALPQAEYAEREDFLALDVRGSCQSWFDYPSDPANGYECDRPASISDPETGCSYCLKCWAVQHA